MNDLPGRLVLLGHPVAHSLSPVFQQPALGEAGISLQYELLDVPPEGLSKTLEEAQRDRWAGNVTIPHKEAVFAACTKVTAVAARAGAVNAFRATPSGIFGHNTDVEAVRSELRTLQGEPLRNTVFGVIGAGGAAAAILTAIEQLSGCTAVVANRNAERLERLVARFSSIARAGDVGEIARSTRFVLNATSLGLREDDPLPIDPATLHPETRLLDVVYTRHETRLVREARALGIHANDGLGMLVGQGAAAFEWWFGVSPDRDMMWRSAHYALYPTDYSRSPTR